MEEVVAINDKALSEEILSKKERNRRAKKARKDAEKQARKVKASQAAEFASDGSAISSTALLGGALIVYGSHKSTSVPSDLLEPPLSHDASKPPPLLRMPEVERDHVQVVYDAIAHQWHGTRYKAWPRVELFIRGLPKHSLLADVGCGNGKNLPAANARGFGVGFDFSSSLVGICGKGRGLEVGVADAVHLPLRSGAWDACVCIAVLHHISTHERRAKLVRETMRVLRVGGRALFYAWAKEQDANSSASGHRFATQDVLVPFHLRISDAKKSSDKADSLRSKRPRNDNQAAASAKVVEKGASATKEVGNVFPGADVAPPQLPLASVAGVAEPTVVDEEKRQTTAIFQRYCHVYCAGELEELFNDLVQQGVVVVEEVYYDCGNWCAVARKKAWF